MRKKHREVHVNGEAWVYAITRRRRWDEPDEIRIYSPTKQLTRVNSNVFHEAVKETDSVQITPSSVKKYIEDFLTDTNTK
jgi:hypothetical protein